MITLLQYEVSFLELHLKTDAERKAFELKVREALSKIHQNIEITRIEQGGLTTKVGK
jgi:hypothetical protein